MTNFLPLVTIIIPVKNNEATISKCLTSIFELNYENYEIILINDGSSDATGNILHEFKIKSVDLDKIKNFKIIETSNVGPSKARNIAIKESKGEFVAFTDGDCIVHKEWINELIKGFVSHIIAGVGGDQQSPQDDTEFGKLVHRFMKSTGFVIDYVKSSSKIIEVEHNPTCNVMYRKEIFSRVGYFLEGLWPGEDVELDYRIKKAGYKLLFNPGAIVYHYRPDNIKKFVNMMERYGKVQSILVKKYGLFRKIHYVPIITLFLLSCIIFFLFKQIYLSLLLILILLLSPLIYFAIKTKNCVDTYKFYMLGMITLFFWHYGFFKQMVKKS